MKRFVVVVDTQVDFMRADGALAVPGAERLIAPMQAWLEGLTPGDTAGILFTHDTHDPERYADSAEAALFPPHCLRGTPGWANVLDPARLDAAIPCYHLYKGVFDMWAEPDLPLVNAADGTTRPRDRFFAAMDRTTLADVVVIGVAADYCVRWAIAGLLERGFRVTVPAALTRGIDRSIETVAAEDFPRSALSVLPISEAIPRQ